MLKGTYTKGVVVKGVCAVKGRARVVGNLTVSSGGTLAAAFGRRNASLTVIGNLVVGRGGMAIVGCKVNPDGSGFPCMDDPNMKHPTLTSHASVTGSIVESSPIGVVVHNTSIGASIKELGGGGGFSCAPPKSGIFATIMSPVYSDYEDSSVGAGVTISGLDSCWLGLARLRVRGSVRITNNEMSDPDAIEIVSNHIRRNLACSGNSHPSPMAPGDQPVWDSGEILQNGSIYPRRPQPNTVGGRRSGQCVLASPTIQGGPSGPGPF